ncbi:hypothetical protein AFAE65S_00201 [Alcaligenes phenolicus]
MNFSYQFELPVPVERAWATLMDIPRVAPCMPGAAIESSDGSNHIGKVRVKLGPIELTYRGAVTLIERDDVQHRARVTVVAKEIKGAGAAKAELTLEATESEQGSTKVSVSSEFSISGKAAQFGRGVVDEVAALMMDQFAQRLAHLLQQEDVPSQPTLAEATVTVTPAAALNATSTASAEATTQSVTQHAAQTNSATEPSITHEMLTMFAQMQSATLAATNAATAAANAASAAATAVTTVHRRMSPQGADSFSTDNEALDMGSVMGAILYRRLKWVALAGAVVIVVGTIMYLGGRS